MTLDTPRPTNGSGRTAALLPLALRTTLKAELTDIVYVELPQVGTSLATRQTAAVVESVKAASDIYAPVSGEVVETNPELESNPALVNTDPYNAGWLFKLKLANPEEISSLKTAAEYSTLIGG